MKSKKDNYVKVVVQDYDKSINSINKYLFSENEYLNSVIDELEERIQKVEDFCFRYLSLNLDDFDSRKLLEKILELLGGKDNE